MKDQSSLHRANYSLGSVMRYPELYQSRLMEMRYYPLMPCDFFLTLPVQKLKVQKDLNAELIERIPKVVR